MLIDEATFHNFANVPKNCHIYMENIIYDKL
jgi:hypothetical protein